MAQSSLADMLGLGSLSLLATAPAVAPARPLNDAHDARCAANTAASRLFAGALTFHTRLGSRTPQRSGASSPPRESCHATARHRMVPKAHSFQSRRVEADAGRFSAERLPRLDQNGAVIEWGLHKKLSLTFQHGGYFGCRLLPVSH